MDVLKGFLLAMMPRRLCAGCLARLTEEVLLATQRRLDAMVRDKTVGVIIGTCGICQAEFPVFWLVMA